MKELKFVPHLVAMIQEGKKTTTWRIFDEKHITNGDELQLVEKENGKTFAHAKVHSVEEKMLKDLTPSDYEGHEGFKSEEVMYQTYKGYYGYSISPTTIVKIIKFTLNN